MSFSCRNSANLTLPGVILANPAILSVHRSLRPFALDLA
jgi:hypothetical protein